MTTPDPRNRPHSKTDCSRLDDAASSSAATSWATAASSSVEKVPMISMPFRVKLVTSPGGRLPDTPAAHALELKRGPVPRERLAAGGGDLTASKDGGRSDVAVPRPGSRRRPARRRHGYELRHLFLLLLLLLLPFLPSSLFAIFVHASSSSSFSPPDSSTFSSSFFFFLPAEVERRRGRHRSLDVSSQDGGHARVSCGGWAHRLPFSWKLQTASWMPR